MLESKEFSVNSRTIFESIHKGYKYPEKIKKIYNLNGDLIYLLCYFIRRDSPKNTPQTSNEGIAKDTNYNVRQIKRFKKKLKELNLISWDIIDRKCTRVVVSYEKMDFDIRSMHLKNFDEKELEKIRAEIIKLGGKMPIDNSNDNDSSQHKSAKIDPMESIMGDDYHNAMFPQVSKTDENNVNMSHRNRTDLIPPTHRNRTDLVPLAQRKGTDLVPHKGQILYPQMNENPINTTISSDVITSLIIERKNLNQRSGDLISDRIYEHETTDNMDNLDKPRSEEPSRQNARIEIDSLGLNQNPKPELTRMDQSVHKISPKPKPSFDFEAAYTLYPRHIGKSKGIAKCIREVKTQKDYDDLISAINNFREAFSDREVRFIKQFDTFMSSWRDYVNKGDFDDDSGTSLAVYEAVKLFDAIQ